MNFGMNLFFATAWVFMIMILADPSWIGEWLAKRDIGYDSIVTEYYGDTGFVYE